MGDPRGFARFGRRCAPVLAVAVTAGLLHGPSGPPIAVAAGPPPTLFDDNDGDGLSDGLELYYNAASTAVAWTTNPYNPDTDGDGQPDGFEFCLSGGRQVYSPDTLWSVVPSLAISSYQVGDDILLGLYVIPGSVNLVQKFHFVLAVPGPTGPQLVDYTPWLVNSISSVGFAHYGAHQMTVYQMKLPLALVRTYGVLTVGAVGTVAGEEVGASVTLAVHGGRYYRWQFVNLVSGNSSGAVGQAIPQDASYPAGMVVEEVCGSLTTHEPTGTPGLLKSVVLAAGCTSGDWACPAGICSMAGVGAEKPVLDVFSLILPPGG